MSWTTAASDLRTQLSDNSEDKHCYRKRVFGEINGTNKKFKTLEFRRLNNFKTADAPPLGIYIDGTLKAMVDVTSDNPPTGDFEMVNAPADGSVVEASYYAQWFTDPEIVLFLRTACNWLALGDDPAAIPEGLRPSAIKYAAAEGYTKLASRWAQMLTEQFILQTAVEKDRFAIVDTWMKAADQARKEAYKSRDDYYKKSGKSNVAYAGSIQGRVTDPVPRR